MIKDDMFKTKYKAPLKLEGPSAIVSHIIRLILLNPGENQSHPEMGVGLISKYRYGFKEDLRPLELDIQTQIETYLPMLKDVDVSLYFDNGILRIGIEITNMFIKMDLKDGKLSLQEVTKN